MPDPQVTVRDDGTLQLTVDGQMLPPISIQAAQALADAIPAARQAASRATLTSTVRDLTGLMAVSPNLVATIDIAGDSLTAHVDPTSFAIIEQVWQQTPAEDGGIHHGPATVFST